MLIHRLDSSFVLLVVYAVSIEIRKFEIVARCQLTQLGHNTS
jgi:hypothetical protein